MTASADAALDPRVLVGPWWLIDCSHDRVATIDRKREDLKPKKLNLFQKALVAGQPKSDQGPTSVTSRSYWMIDFVGDPFASNDLKLRARYYRDRVATKGGTELAFIETDQIAAISDREIAVRFPELFGDGNIAHATRRDLVLALADWSSDYLVMTRNETTEFKRIYGKVSVDLDQTGSGTRDTLESLRERLTIGDKNLLSDYGQDWYARIKTTRPNGVCLTRGPTE